MLFILALFADIIAAVEAFTATALPDSQSLRRSRAEIYRLKTLFNKRTSTFTELHSADGLQTVNKLPDHPQYVIEANVPPTLFVELGLLDSTFAKWGEADYYRILLAKEFIPAIVKRVVSIKFEENRQNLQLLE